MRVKNSNKTRKTKPSTSLEFDTDFEQDKFLEFLKKLNFDGINYKMVAGIGRVSIKPKFCLAFNTLADYQKFISLQKALPADSSQADLFANKQIKSDLELEIDRLAQQSKAQAEAQRNRQTQEKKLSEFALVKSKLENGQPISAELRRKYPELVKKYEELDLISGLGNHSFYNQIGCKCRNQEYTLGLSIGDLPRVDNLSDLKPVAYLFPVSDIKTDAKRFQNRTDAFSELSAESVAKNYNENIFDPIVIWFDEAKKIFYVLSGHSRLEGMKRRSAKFIPARFFKGTEAEAIVFARVDANRAATKENLVEDLKAYKLMRDGDLARNIAPADKKSLKNAFKNKTQTLEALSFLNQKGNYIEQLANEESISQFPRIQSFANWVGNLRKQYPHFTNTHEDDTFNFFYGDDKNQKVKREDFEQLVKERLSYGKPRLFPECKPGEPCKDIKDLKKEPPNGHLYQEIDDNQKAIDLIRSRFSTPKAGLKIYTDGEKDKLKELAKTLETRNEKLKRDLGILETTPALFGVDEVNFEFSYDFFQLLGFRLQGITKQEIETCFASNNAQFFEFKGVAFREMLYFYIAYNPDNRKFILVEFCFKTPKIDIINAYRPSKKIIAEFYDFD